MLRRRLGLQRVRPCRRARRRHGSGGRGVRRCRLGVAKGLRVGVALVKPARGFEGDDALGDRGASLSKRQPGVDRNERGLICVKDPVPVFSWQIFPWHVNVIAEGHQHVAELVSVPCRRPGRDRALPDRERRIRHHPFLGHRVDTTNAVTLRAGPLHRVRRKILRVEHRLPIRIVPGAGVQHPHETGHRGDASHRGPSTASSTLLLQRHGRRHPGDGVNIGNARLVDQTASVRRHRLQIPSLRLGVQRPKRQR